MSAETKRPPLLPFLATLLSCCVCARLHAHPYSVLWSEMTVSKDKVHVRVTLTVEDFFYVYKLKPNEADKLAEKDIQASLEKHKAYVLKHLHLYDIDGKRLKGLVVKTERLDPMDISVPMSERIRYTLEYPLKLPAENLTLCQDYGGQGSVLPTVMNVKVTQDGHPARPMFLLESGGMQILEFDWLKTPQAAKDMSQEEWERERQERLGITNYGSVYSFLYIEPHEIRHEILVPLASLNLWVYVERKKPSEVTVEEQEAARDKVFAFFAEKNPLEIDGVRVKPRLTRMDFYDLEFRDLARRPPPRTVPSYAARIGLILSYPTTGTPEEVSMKWELFSRDIRQLHTVVIDHEEGVRKTLTRTAPALFWQDPGRPPFPTIHAISLPTARTGLTVPVLSLLLLAAIPFLIWRMKRRGAQGAHLRAAVLSVLLATACVWPFFRVEVPDPRHTSDRVPEPEHAIRIFGSLLKNIYRAFAYNGQSEIYDALAKSVDGDLLAKLYLQIRESLEMREQGGAVSRVQDVKMERSTFEPLDAGEEAHPGTPGFTIDCSWTVRGTVEHWGHIHARTNRYAARFEIRASRGAWRITAMDVQKQERVNFETRLRTW